MTRIALTALGLVLGLASGPAPGLAATADAPFARQRLEWNKPFKPFRVIGNIYYVGPAGVSAFLIVTPQGDILTDGGLPESAPLIEANIRALGFKVRDNKVLLNSHAHFDHAGGLAKLKADSAKFYASAADRPILESGRIAFGPAAVIPFTPVHVDHVVTDGERVSLGGITLTAHLTPGHTPGCTTWTMKLADAGITHHVMFFCSMTVAGNPLANNPAYPAITADYKASFAKLKTMDADIFLAPHGEQFDLAAKVTRMRAGGPNPFIDPGEMRRVTGRMAKAYDSEMVRQFEARPQAPQAKE